MEVVFGIFAAEYVYIALSSWMIEFSDVQYMYIQKVAEIHHWISRMSFCLQAIYLVTFKKWRLFEWSDPAISYVVVVKEDWLSLSDLIWGLQYPDYEGTDKDKWMEGGVVNMESGHPRSILFI